MVYQVEERLSSLTEAAELTECIKHIDAPMLCIQQFPSCIPEILRDGGDGVKFSSRGEGGARGFASVISRLFTPRLRKDRSI